MTEDVGNIEPMSEILRQLFATDSRAIAVVGAELPHQLVWANDSFTNLFGEPLADKLMETDSGNVLTAISEALSVRQSNANSSVEIPLTDRAGVKRLFGVRATEAAGSIALVFEDITEKCTLRNTTEILQTVMNNYPGGVVWTDEDNNILFVNDKVLQFAEMTHDEILGRKPGFFQTPRSESEIAERSSGKFIAEYESKSGKFVPVEVERIVHNKTECFPCLLPFAAGRDCSVIEAYIAKPGKAVNIYLMRNVSEFVARGDALRHSQEQNNSLLRNLRGIAFRCSKDNNWSIDWMSEGALDLTGFTAEEFTREGGVEYNSLIRTEDYDRIRKQFDDCIVRNVPFDAEYKIHTREGEEKWVLERSKPLFGADGSIVAVEGFIIDITDKKKHEEQIVLSNRIYQMLSETNQAVVRIRDKAELFREICRIACEEGLYSGSFIALLDEYTDDVNLEAYYTQMPCNWESFALTRDNLHKDLFSNGKFFTTNCPETCQNEFPVLEFLRTNNVRAFAAFPITMFDQIIGVFGICHDREYSFAEEEIKLLQELAIDVSFAIEFLIIEEERQNVASALHSAAEMFKVVAEHTGHLIYNYNVQSDTVTWSGAIKSITGYAPRDFFLFTMKDWSSMIHPEDQENVRTDLNKAALAKENYFITYRLQNKDGNYIYTEDTGTFEYDDAGLAIRALGVVKDVTKRRLIEIKLTESEQRLRTLINSTPDIICFKDGAGRWLAANDADIELFQLKGIDYVGKTDIELAEFTHPMYREAFLGCTDSDNLTWEAKRATQTEDTIPVSETEAKVYDVIKVPVYNSDGSRKGLVVLGRDITGRKIAEKKLNYQTEFLNKIIENLPLGLYARDAKNDYKHTVWNARIEEMLSIDRKNVIGKSLAELIPNDLAELYTDSDKAVMLGGDPVDLPYEIVNTGLGRFECHTIKVPLYDSAGEPDTMLGIVEDISEKLKAQRIQDLVYSIAKASIVTKDTAELYSIIQSELSEIMDTTNFIIVLYNKDDHTLSLQYMQDQKDHFDTFPAGKTLSSIVIANKESLLLKTSEMERLEKEGVIDQVGSMSACWLGVPLLLNGEVIGLIVVQSYDDENAYNDEHKRILEFISSQVAISITKKRAEDALFALNMELEERVAERTKQFEDAMIELRYENEERRRTQEELYEAKNELSIALKNEIELNELKNRFISMVSHEYRTPLTVILSSSYLVEAAFKKHDENVFNKYNKLVQSSVANMTKLLEDVLFMGKVYSGKLDSKFNQFNLNDLLSTIIEEVRAIDREEHIFVPEFQNEKMFIDADEKLIHQIVLNLLTNACKYSPSGTEIRVESFDREDDIGIGVADSGIGIPQDELEKLFEPFHRLTNVGTIPGTGLGLSIVKNCVDTLGGEIRVDSQIDEGTRFVVIIPRAKNPQE